MVPSRKVLLHRLSRMVSVFFLAGGCQAPSQAGPDHTQKWQGTVVEEGTTRIVRTTSGSVWGGDGRLVEEVAFGTEVRGETDMLAQVYGIDALDDRIYVLDRILNTVRVYDMDGVHIQDIGREGEGPGEFERPTALGIDPYRRHVIVREGVGTLHRFTLDGEFVGRTPFNSLMSISGPDLCLRVTLEGSAILFHYFFGLVPGERYPIRKPFLYTIDPGGTLTDSLDFPISDDEPYILKSYVNAGTYRPEPVPFAPQKVWSLGWDGAFIYGFAEDYGFEIRYPDGRRTVIQREADSEPVQAGEKEAQERRVYALLRDTDPRWSWDGPEIPDVKPWYSDIIPDHSGRLWVVREGKGQPVEGWSEPEPDDWRGWKYDLEWVSKRWFEVFDEASGRYLGRVDAPEGFLVEPEPFIEGNTFISLTKDEFDRPIVRRYRLDLPNEGLLPGSSSVIVADQASG